LASRNLGIWEVLIDNLPVGLGRIHDLHLNLFKGGPVIRQKIEIEKGAIAPVKRTLWAAAIEKLQEAQAGFQQMNAAKDRIAFEQGWICAVDSLAVFWVRFFDEGKVTFSNFQPWAGRQEADWKKDELMMYLYQSRNISQHGRFEFEWDDGQLRIAPNFNGHIKALAIFDDGTFSLSATKLPGSVTEATVRFAGGHASLPVVKNHREQPGIYPPPTVLDGVSRRRLTPAEAVKAGIDYYTNILNQAFKKFGEHSRKG
jgi:hypothetical protein